MITNTRCVISDLLLSLLFPFSPFAQIWPDETGQGLHTLLHVSCHSLLQRQGRHLTPHHHRKHTVHAMDRATAVYKANAALLW